MHKSKYHAYIPKTLVAIALIASGTNEAWSKNDGIRNH